MKFPTKTSDEVEFVKILKLVNDEVIKKDSIINGWRGTGLQPFDFNNLRCDDLVSKSPDCLYDFKGDHIISSKILSMSTSTVQKQPVNVLSDFLLDEESRLYFVPDNLPSSSNTNETIDELKDIETMESFLPCSSDSKKLKFETILSTIKLFSIPIELSADFEKRKLLASCDKMIYLNSSGAPHEPNEVKATMNDNTLKLDNDNIIQTSLADNFASKKIKKKYFAFVTLNRCLFSSLIYQI